MWAVAWIMTTGLTVLSYWIARVVTLPTHIPTGLITVATLALAGVEIVVLLWMHGRMLSGAIRPLQRGQEAATPAVRYVMANTVVSAMAASLAVYGLIAYLIDRFAWTPVAFAVLASLLLLHFRPDVGELQRLLAKQPSA